ncbi:MAG: tetratricopeptide repeat protein [Winogradskyella sp.]|nr:tetratricopeptide repeat protein [Winogradskyella sp.]
MKVKRQIRKIKTLLFCVTLALPLCGFTQVDFNKTPDDDLGDVKDAFQEYFFEALKQKGIENYERAVDALQECLKIDSTKTVVYYELGKNYNQLKAYDSALKYLKIAANSQPDNEWILDELYDVYIKLDDVDSAIETVEQLIRYHPDYKEDLAGLYVRVERYTDALSLLDELDAKYGVNESRATMRNNIYTISGNDTERVSYLKEQIALNPSNEENYLKLIYRYSQSGDIERAFNTAKELLNKKPNSVLVHLALYKFYIERDEIEDAVSSMKIAIQSPEINADAKAKVLIDFVNFVSNNPEYEKDLIEITDSVDNNESPETLANLGQYYLKAGDKQKALRSFEEALKQNPNDFKLIKDILLLKLELQDINAVIIGAEDALALFPAQPLLYLIKGVAHNNLKQADEAIENLELGLEFLIENKDMEYDFYTQLSIAHQLNNNITQANTFSKKAKALKGQN